MLPDVRREVGLVGGLVGAVGAGVGLLPGVRHVVQAQVVGRAADHLTAHGAPELARPNGGQREVHGVHLRESWL